MTITYIRQTPTGPIHLRSFKTKTGTKLGLKYTLRGTLAKRYQTLEHRHTRQASKLGENNPMHGVFGEDHPSFKHGHAVGGKWSREYTKFNHMHSRCDGTATRSKWHHGNGVQVCERWARGPEGFTNFLADMGKCPPGQTLERINPFGDYEPGNCKWATWDEQNNNKRSHYEAKHGPQPTRLGYL